MKISEAGQKRIKAIQQEMALVEKVEPLRRPLLKALLSNHPGASFTIEELQYQLEEQGISASSFEIRSQMERIVDDGLAATDVKSFQANVATQTAFNDHTAFGATEPLPPSPTRQETLRYLEEARRGALRIKHDKQEIRERLELILEQGKKLNADQFVADLESDIAAL